MFISQFGFIDTDFIVCAHPCEGSGPHDGKYGIGVMIASEGRLKRVWFDYPSRDARDADFAAMGKLVRQVSSPENDEGTHP
jgi:hypothetical protein